MIIPYFALIISNFTANMETIKGSIPLLVVTIVFACTIVLSFFLQIIRYLFYCGEVVEKEEVKEEQEPVEPEVAQEDTPNEEVEEVVVVEEPVVVEEEVEEEQPVYEEEVVEEVTEEPEEVIVEEVVEEEQEPVEEEEYDEEEFEEEDAQEDETEDDQYEEEPAVAPAKERDILMPEVTIVDENGAPKKIKRRFNTRMMFAPYEAKEYYNEIKNYLIMYRAKGRYSARCETFRYRGLVAKVALAGKSIKVCLAIDPQSLVGTKYHFKDVSEKKQYAEVPTMIKVRSSRGLKYFKELVDIMMANRGVKPKRNYEPTNFMPQLIPNGEAILATLGMSTDYLYPSMNARSIPAEMPDDLEEYLPVIQGEELQEEEVEASIYLDTLCNHFIDGDEITIDVLKLSLIHI